MARRTPKEIPRPHIMRKVVTIQDRLIGTEGHFWELEDSIRRHKKALAGAEKKLRSAKSHSEAKKWGIRVGRLRERVARLQEEQGSMLDRNETLQIMEDEEKRRRARLLRRIHTALQRIRVGDIPSLTPEQASLIKRYQSMPPSRFNQGHLSALYRTIKDPLLRQRLGIASRLDQRILERLQPLGNRAGPRGAQRSKK